MRKTLFLAAVLSTVAFGVAQAQNYTIPAGDAGFNRGHDAGTASNATPAPISGFQAFFDDAGSSFNRVVIAPLNTDR